MPVACVAGMNLTPQNRRALVMGAAGVAALLLAQAWRRRTSYDFAGKSVVITGGSRGLGLILARQLADQGASLTLAARTEEDLEQAAEDIRSRTRAAHVLTVSADLRDRDDAERVVASAVEEYGRIDVLINNAGIIQMGPVDHMNPDDYDDAMKTHFWGPLYATLAAVPFMRRQGEGRIVNISSIAGRIAVPHLAPYSASKFALTGLSDGLRYELARDNILVTTVCPGLMRTGSPVNAMFKGRRPEEYAWFAISGSLPLTSIDADRAARQIVEACRHGEAELVITLQAKVAILARTIAPEFFADAMSFMNHLLPPPTGHEGDRPRPGHESESTLVPAPVREATHRAAERNNEE
jgi:NAD(P)-dependent dehydrogenase (short-subunit alcohol dehydrogenase family)